MVSSSQGLHLIMHRSNGLYRTLKPNPSLRAGKWLRKNLGFEVFKSPIFRFLRSFIFWSNFIQIIKFHILIVIYVFCYILQKML